MKSSPPTVEQLEERIVPVVWGNPWPDAMHLTLSFVQDGTPAGTNASQLQSLLDAQASRQAWQREVLRSFQTWAVNANINIGLVADGGQALGSAGRPQGDARFGDVRDRFRLELLEKCVRCLFELRLDHALDRL